MENRNKKQLEDEKLKKIHGDIGDDDFNKSENSLDAENDKTKKQKWNSLHNSLNFFCIVCLLAWLSISLLQDTLWEYTLILAIWFGCLILISIWLVLFNCIRYLVNFLCRVVKWEEFRLSKWKNFTIWEIIGIIILIYLIIGILLGILLGILQK